MLLSRSFLSAALAACVMAAVAGCGSGDDPAGLKGTNVTGPGVTDAQVNGPDVKPNPGTFPVEREHLAQRIRLLGLPPVGSEKFHQHALLNIYYDGLLVPLASGIGLDNKRKVFSSLHTHAQTTVPGTSVKPSPNVIHMESDKPFKATLGDFFAVWGVSFGPDHIGALKADDGREMHVYVNVKDGQDPKQFEVADPATYVIKKNDKFVITLDDGKQNIDLTPDDKPLRDANSGKSGCSTGGKGKAPVSCIIGDE